MELTTAKLQQIIKEELNKVLKEMTRDEYEFQKRRKGVEAISDYRAYGDPDQPFEYPEYTDKLRTLYSSGDEGKNQAIELARSLDEPLDVPIEFDIEDIDRPQKQKPLPPPSPFFQKSQEMYIRFLRGELEEEPYNEDYVKDELLKKFGDTHGKNREQAIRQRIALVNQRAAFRNVFSKRR